ncbi:helix-turn-helix domain-containing protein [Streptomyces sp. NPDC089919]|uniref:helix-turn-helix domain-containing protein n=1 Tax=Streptomyces sp. NPDC089919 TaxID=3155188 RepID=UPI00344284ED
MAFQHPSAGLPSKGRSPRGTARSGGISGVTHSRVPLTSNFTLVANQLAQHAALSLLAIGLSVHIQSLPTGSPVTIRDLADRFPESELRIGRALHELEAAGYLRRTRIRLPIGQVVTRTVSYNLPLTPFPPPAPGTDPDPGPDPDPEPAPQPDPDSDPDPEPPPPVPDPRSPGPARPSVPPQPDPPAAQAPPADVRALAQRAAQPSASAQIEASASAAGKRKRKAGRGQGAGPAHWTTYDTDEKQQAAHLLATLRARDPRFLLAERDIARLVPEVVRWLETVPAEGVRRTLTADIPHDLRNPAGLLAYRLKHSTPVPVPALQGPPGHRPPDRVIHPLQTCDGCDRAFRAARPGHCADCRPSYAPRAA